MGFAEGLRELEATAPLGGAIAALSLRDTARVREILASAVKWPDEVSRAAAIAAELCLGLDRSLEDAVGLLASKSTAAREFVIQGLGDSGLEAAITPLRSLLPDDRLPLAERIRVAEALVKLGERSHIEFIVGAFPKARDMDRVVAYMALGEVADATLLPLLQAAIEKDTEDRLLAVIATARILGRKARGTTKSGK